MILVSRMSQRKASKPQGPCQYDLGKIPSQPKIAVGMTLSMWERPTSKASEREFFCTTSEHNPTQSGDAICGHLQCFRGRRTTPQNTTGKKSFLTPTGDQLKPCIMRFRNIRHKTGRTPFAQPPSLHATPLYSPTQKFIKLYLQTN